MLRAAPTSAEVRAAAIGMRGFADTTVASP
jgi:hypothetical protein